MTFYESPAERSSRFPSWAGYVPGGRLPNSRQTRRVFAYRSWRCVGHRGRLAGAGLTEWIPLPKTVFLHPRSGRGCRFMVGSPEALAPLIVLLGEHGIPCKEVRTTYPHDRIT